MLGSSNFGRRLLSSGNFRDAGLLRIGIDTGGAKGLAGGVQSPIKFDPLDTGLRLLERGCKPGVKLSCEGETTTASLFEVTFEPKVESGKPKFL